MVKIPVHRRCGMMCDSHENGTDLGTAAGVCYGLVNQDLLLQNELFTKNSSHKRIKDLAGFV
jgi:hypothetical protein